MITLAILYWLAAKIGGTVGEDWFYESLPIDPMTGKVTGYGVYAITQQAPKEQAGPLHTYITLYIVAGEGYKDKDGHPLPEKQATDQLADRIWDCVCDALDDPTSWHLTIPTTHESFNQVRITPDTSKDTQPFTSDGAVVKSLNIEVFYQKEKTNG